MDFQEELKTLLAQRTSAPFLFVGSGFSRRYLGIEDWDGLLSKFCITGKPYNFYKSSANKDTALAARLLSEEYHNHWWTSELFEEERKSHEHQITDKTSPLRIGICKYLKSASERSPTDENLIKEINLLKSCDVDGIITTNWDLLLEKTFPNYRVFTGQNELLFSNPLSMAEIYKIHGCCTQPESLILTDNDYSNYNERNAYLAAKLITIFVENPIIFIGYSISDPNIRALIKSIASCIGPKNIIKLQDNLLFVSRKQPATGPLIETSYLQFDDTQIPIKLIKTSDFSPVYEAISGFQRKLPARVLRFCKERVFELVKDSTADKKIAVIDFDSIEDPSSVEVVFGLGLLDKFGEQGYRAITTEDLFEDLIMDDRRYNAINILKITLHDLPGKTKFIPIFKYLRSAGITSIEKYKESGLALNKFIRNDATQFATNPNQGLGRHFGCTVSDFLKTATESEIISMLPLIPGITHSDIEEYLVDNFNKALSGTYKYQYRRIMAFYDWLRYGFGQP